MGRLLYDAFKYDFNRGYSEHQYITLSHMYEYVHFMYTLRIPTFLADWY